MNSSNASPHRNWMQDEQPTGGKWIWITLLTLFIIAGLVLMGVLMRTPPTTRTYLASICIGEYPDNILPSPVYAGWPHSEFLGGFEQRGLESWLTLDPYLADSSPRSRNEFDEDLASLSGVLKGRGAKSRDTLVLYLRGHALVIDGEAHLLIGEFDRDQLLNSQEFRVPLAEIFAALQQLDVANVIVLADVCDLRTFPAAGVVANHVPQQIGRLIEDVNADASRAGARLWVITACASLQPAYASGLQQRSLFQAACEFACSSRSAANAEQLSLADFYEGLLRYSDFASSGEQTPLLFCSGSGGHLLENSASASQAWLDAQEVHLAGRLPAKPASAASQADAAADSMAQSEEKDSLPAASPRPQPGS
ncbi:MAG: hypothetical protein NXI32_27825, partial [bacterium]|nr:hypothetical protein [bacterium]